MSNFTDTNTTGAPTVFVASAQFVETFEAKFIALLCTVFSLVVSLYNVQQHLLYYSAPVLQRHIIRILFIVPIYSVFSFLTLIFPHLSLYMECIRDVWEAVVVYSFLKLLMEFCGGENACLAVIMNHPGSVRHVFPFGYCLRPMPLTSHFLRFCTQTVLQFVFIKPTMALTSLILLGLNQYDNSTYQIILSIIYNTSYSVALYSLYLFYQATHEHPGIVQRRPLYKFLAVKTVVFATYYQSLIIPAFPLTHEQVNLWNSFILCCEMVFFSVLHACAFPASEYRTKSSKTQENADKLSPSYNGSGTQQHKTQAEIERDLALKNARDVISMKDVAKDAYYNFTPKYGSHVQLNDDEDDFDANEHNAMQHTSVAEDDQDTTQRGSMAGEIELNEKTTGNMFSNIGTTFKSLKTGGNVRVNVDLESNKEEFPFQTFKHSPSKEEAEDAGKNPFIDEVNDPLALNKSGKRDNSKDDGHTTLDLT